MAHLIINTMESGLCQGRRSHPRGPNS